MLLLLLACGTSADKPDDSAADTDIDTTPPADDSGDTGADTSCPAAWYTDADADGYGGEYAGSGCVAPQGTVGTDGDCADDDAARHPGVDEVCDGVDQDCDGEADEEAVDARAWYVDGDADGFGTTETFGCAADGLSAASGDCNDGDALIHPTAEETCGDSVDQDCDGADAICAPALELDVELDADTTWIGDDQWLGFSLGSPGDLDGDGVVDLMIQSSYPSSSSGGGGSGRAAAVSVVYGGSFTTATYAATDIPEKWLEDARNDIDLRGDFDGDGNHDVAWMGYEPDGKAGVGIVWGDGTRWTDGGYATSDTTFEATLPDYMGSQMGVGDADGDGADDIIASIGAGAAVIYGDTSGLSDGSIGDQPALKGSGTWFGGGGVEIGDLDGDGLGDFVVADVYADMSGADYPGALYVAYSDSRLTGDLALPGDEDAVFRGPTGMGLVYMGYRVATGDLDGDGYGEIAAGAHMYDSAKGMVWVFGAVKTRWSGEYTTADAVGSVYGETASPMGVSVDMPADIDGDGGDELFVGATNAGVYLFYGDHVAGALTDADADVALTGGPTDSKVGYDLGSGDLDDDGVPDLVAAAYNAYHSGDGAVWLFSGAGL